MEILKIGDEIEVVVRIMEITENKEGRFFLVEQADGKGSTCMRIPINNVLRAVPLGENV